MLKQLLGMLLFVGIFLGISGLGHFYILKRFFGFYDLKTGIWFWILFLVLSSSMVLAMILDSTFQNPLTWVFHYLAALWFGVWFLFICALSIYELSRIFYSPPKVISGIVIISVVALLSVYAFWNARQLNSRELVFPADVDADLVQLSDVHFGSPGGMDFSLVAEKLRKINPDAVLITGDLIEPTSRPDEIGIKLLDNLDCPVYLSLGNHERYAGDHKLEQLLGNSKIKVLRNEAATVKGIKIIGLDDSEDPRQVERKLKGLDLDDKQFNLLMYHRPDGFKDAVKAGIDLMLSGHTHNGQIWPFSWLVRIRFPQVNGLYENNRHWLYVTPGTGNWGPPMRLGSRCEIVHIKLRRSS